MDSRKFRVDDMPETAVRERPILFSAPMVRAILDGRKTITRRVIRPQPTDIGHDVWEFRGARYVGEGATCDHLFHNVYGGNDDRAMPYGGVYDDHGDRLWVRETFYIDDERAIGKRLPKKRPEWFDDDTLYYRADGECCEQIPECQCATEGKPSWRPSIFMPRWASRITLEIEDVRVERLQEITESDAIAEGAPCIDNPDHDPEDPMDDPQTHLAGFIDLWQKLNGSRGFGWDVNPWVWVISFRRITDV